MLSPPRSWSTTNRQPSPTHNHTAKRHTSLHCTVDCLVRRSVYISTHVEVVATTDWEDFREAMAAADRDDDDDGDDDMDGAAHAASAGDEQA